LAAWLGRSDLSAAADPRDQLPQLQSLLAEAARLPAEQAGARPPRVLFFLDGMEVIGQADPEFREVPFLLAGANVFWVCAGRPEPWLPKVFAPDRCVHLFPDGLPPMSEADIRGMLLEETGRLKYELLEMDRDRSGPDAGGQPQQVSTNAAVDAITR